MRCPHCDTPNRPEAERCEECGKKIPPRKRPAQVEEEAIEDDERRPVKPWRRPRDGDDDEDEEHERRPRHRSMRRRDSSDEVVSTIIPYKNPKALAGHYCGIFSLFPILGIVLAARARYSDGILSLFPILGIVLGAVAIVLGVMGLRYVKENPEAHGTAHAVVAIILGILGLLIGLSCGTVLIFITRPGNFP